MPNEPAEPQAPQRPDDTADDEILTGHAAELGTDETPEILPSWRPARAFLRSLSLAEAAIGVILLAAILVMVLIQVGQRYVPNMGIPPTGELARLSMVWLTFVMSGYLMAHDRHIAIHVVDYFLPKRVLGGVQLLASAVVFFTCVGMAYATWDLIAGDRGQVTAEARVPLTVVYAVALFGFASTALRAVVTAVALDLPRIAGAREEPT